MANGYAAPVITGLALGVSFIVLFAFLGSNIHPLYSKPSSDNTLQDPFEAAERMTRELDEVRAFMSVYPNANSIVYFVQICSDDSCSSLSRIPSTVEYWFKEEDSRRYAELRVSLHYENMEPTSMQIRCTLYGTEEVGVSKYGTTLDNIREFLEDDQCPE